MSQQESFLFLSNTLPIEDLHGWALKITRVPKLSSKFSACVLKSRELLFSFTSEILVWPSDDQQVIVIAKKDFFNNKAFNDQVKQLNLAKDGDFHPVRNIPHVAACFKYSLTARLSPEWNPVGKRLLAGKQFLHSKEPIMGVEMEVNISGPDKNQVEISLTSHTVKFNLMEPSDLNISQQTVMKFMEGDDDEVLHDYSFGNMKVKVLPNLTPVNLVSISKRIPDNTIFASWQDMRRYWKNMYGYRLTEETDLPPTIFYNVQFRRRSAVLTYPEWCIRRHAPRTLRRIDPQPPIVHFAQSVAVKFSDVLGSKFHLDQQIRRTSSEMLPSNQIKGDAFGLVQGFTTPNAPYRSLPAPSSSTSVSNPWEEDQSRRSNTAEGASTSTLPSNQITEGLDALLAEMSYTEEVNPVQAIEKPKRIVPIFGSRTAAASSTTGTIKDKQDKPIQNTDAPPVKPSFAKRPVNLAIPTTASNAPAVATGEKSCPSFKKSLAPRSLPSSKFLENLKTAHSHRIKTGEFPAAAVTSKGDGKVIRDEGVSLSATPSTSAGRGHDTPAQHPLHVFSGLKPPGGTPTPEGRAKPVGSSEEKTSPKKRRRAMQDVNVEDVARLSGASGLMKVNAATLLQFLRSRNVKEAKVKTKKEQLVSLTLSLFNSQPDYINQMPRLSNKESSFKPQLAHEACSQLNIAEQLSSTVDPQSKIVKELPSALNQEVMIAKQLPNASNAKPNMVYELSNALNQEPMLAKQLTCTVNPEKKPTHRSSNSSLNPQSNVHKQLPSSINPPTICGKQFSNTNNLQQNTVKQLPLTVDSQPSSGKQDSSNVQTEPKVANQLLNTLNQHLNTAKQPQNISKRLPIVKQLSNADDSQPRIIQQLPSNVYVIPQISTQLPSEFNPEPTLANHLTSNVNSQQKPVKKLLFSSANQQSDMVIQLTSDVKSLPIIAKQPFESELLQLNAAKQLLSNVNQQQNAVKQRMPCIANQQPGIFQKLSSDVQPQPIIARPIQKSSQIQSLQPNVAKQLSRNVKPQSNIVHQLSSDVKPLSIPVKQLLLKVASPQLDIVQQLSSNVKPKLNIAKELLDTPFPQSNVAQQLSENVKLQPDMVQQQSRDVKPQSNAAKQLPSNVDQQQNTVNMLLSNNVHSQQNIAKQQTYTIKELHDAVSVRSKIAIELPVVGNTKLDVPKGKRMSVSKQTGNNNQDDSIMSGVSSSTPRKAQKVGWHNNNMEEAAAVATQPKRARSRATALPARYRDGFMDYE